MQGFRRRTYASLREIWDDLSYVLSNRRRIRPLMRGQVISPSFRERLMLTVTGVNRCRYCAYFHANEAVRIGLSEAELRSLLTGQLPPDTPSEELLALTYAQHWAETNGWPDPEFGERVLAAYGPTATEAIHLALRMIRMGNLSGNTADYLLYRLSFGRLGLRQDEKGSAAH